MPNQQEFVKLLAKLGLDTTDWNTATKSIIAKLAEVDKQEQTRAAVRKRAIADETAAINKKIATELEGQKAVSAAAAKQVEALKAQKQAVQDIASASVRLKAQIDLEAIATSTVLKKRQDIVAQCEVEMEKLTKLRYPSEQQLQTLRQISAERDKQLSAINRQQAAAQRLTAQTLRQNEAEARRAATATAAAAKRVVAPETQQIARLRAQINTTDVLTAKERAKIETQITAILDKQIAALKMKTNLDREDLATLNRLAAARARSAAASVVRPSGGGGGGGGSFLGGLLGGGGMFGAVVGGTLTAQLVGGMVKGLAVDVKNLIMESGKLDDVRDAFEKLGQVKGVDTIKFLKQLRVASLDMVGDVQLIRMANAALASNLKVTTDQIARMVHDVASLSQSQGRDPRQAMQALQTSFTTGRFMSIARATGIQTSELQLGKLAGSTMPQAAKSTQQFLVMLDAMDRKMSMLGEPTLNFADKMEVLDTKIVRIKNSFAEGLQGSGGFQVFLKFIDTVSAKLDDIEVLAGELGEKFGEAFAATVPVIENVATAISNILSSTYQLLVVFQEFARTVTGFNLLFANMGQRFSGVANVLITFSEGLEIITSGFQLFVRSITEAIGLTTRFVDLMAHPPSTDALKKFFADSKKADTDYKQWVADSNKKLADDIARSEDARSAMNGPRLTHPKTAPGVELPMPPDFAFETKLQKLRMELAQATAKAELEAKKQELEGEKAANESAYQQMLETYSQYINNKKKIRQDELKAEIEEARQERDARIAELAFEQRLATIDLSKQVLNAQAGGMKEGATAEEQARSKEMVRDLQDEVKLTGSTYEIRKKIADVQFQSKTRAAQISAMREQAQMDMELVKDHETAVRKGIEAELDLKKQSLQEQVQATEDSFKDGLSSAQDYLDKRRQQIEAEKQLAIDSAYETYQNSVRSEANLADFRIKAAKAEIDARKQLTKLASSEDDVRLKAVQDSYEKINRTLQTRATLAKTPGGQAIVGDTEIGAITKVIALNTQYIEQLRIQAELVKDQPNQYAKVLDLLAKAQQEQEQYNQRLAEARDILTPVGNLLSKLGGELSKFGSHGIRDLAQGLQAGGQTFTSMGEFATGIGAQLGTGSNVFKAVFETGRSAFDALKTSADSTKETVSEINNSLFQFADVLQSVAVRIASSFSLDAGSMPHFAEGGPVSKTGPAWLHAGEFVIPPGGMQSMGSGAGALNQIVQQIGDALNNFKTQLVQFSQVMGQATANTASAAGVNIAGLPGMFPTPGNDPLAKALGAGVGPAAPGGGSGPSAFSQSVFGQLESATKGFLKALSGQGEGNGVGAIKAFTGALSGAIGAVGSFIQSTAGASTTTGGAVGGALSGMSMGSMFGPWGALAGAVGGGIFGGIMGNKAASATKQLNDLKTTFNNLMVQMNENLTGLNQTIQQAEQLRQKTASVNTGKSSSAKQQKQQQLDQMDQTLQQLKEKQKQVLQQMQQDLDTLRVPTAYQEWLGGLQQILAQYKQFAEAAQTTQDLANAQEYLTDSVKQWAVTQGDQVRQSEIDAINNAIQLNQLYQQRQTLMEDFGKQEQQILSGGVLTRTASASATKAGQLGDLQRNFNQQMDQLNQEIAVSQYKLQSQQQIFNLASTQAGLETQVLQLQFQQIDEQTASTGALENLLNTVKNTPMSQLATMPQLLGALGLPYSGPSAAQVGPQVGPLTANAPVYPSSNQYPNYPTYPSNPSNPPWVYTGGASSAGSTAGGNYVAYQGNTAVPMMSGPSSLPGWALPGGGGAGGIIPSLAATSGIGSNSGASLTLGAAMAYPGMAQQGSINLGAGGIPGGGPIVKMGTSNPANLWPSLFPGVPQAATMNYGSKTYRGGEASLTVHDNVMHARISVEKTINDTTNQRISAEMNLISAKKAQTDYDMQHIAALQKLTDSIKGGSIAGLTQAASAIKNGVRTGPGTTHIESSMYELYRERSRYGEGTFTGPIP